MADNMYADKLRHKRHRKCDFSLVSDAATIGRKEQSQEKNAKFLILK